MSDHSQTSPTGSAAEGAAMESVSACDFDNPKADALVRELLAHFADKWTIPIFDALYNGPMRFTRLRDRLDGISQKMLTQTLRQLERDGLVTRHVHPVVPPHVEYRLSPLGESLGETLCALWHWAGANSDSVDAAREAFDAARPKEPA